MPFRAAIACLLLLAPATARAASGSDRTPPVAHVFVFPVGDELDFKKPGAGESSGFRVSDPYLSVRKARKHRPRRLHYGTDFSAGRPGSVVRAVAAGVVEECDPNALVKVRTPRKVRVAKTVNGKKVHRTITKYRTTWKWRNGWGNRILIRHMLPNGQVVYSLYAHLLPRSVTVRVGDVVTAGQSIARVGKTGRASAPHLHLEIRTTRLYDMDEIPNPDSEAEEDDPGDRRETQSPHTVDPLAFLVDHVLRFEDLEPGSWQARYALAAMKDGIMAVEKGKFDPDDDVTRSEFYAALVRAFDLAPPVTSRRFESSLDALIDAGILDRSARSLEAKDRVEGSDALELVLRCLDRSPCHGQCMSRLKGDQLAHDFNVQFAGKEEARKAEAEALRIADEETAARRKVAKKGSTKRPRKVEPVKPVPLLDPGFESLAQSTKKLSRAEACLLLASALRIGSSNVSALERAATRAAKTG